MKSMTPIKSIRLVAAPAKGIDERDDKGVVTSVHGIINTEFPNFADFYNAAGGRKRSLSNYKNKNVQIITREVKTIKLEMPVLGLEHAVVFPDNKPTKLPLRKRLFKNLENRLPTSNILKKIEEEIKNEKKDVKSVSFSNEELENISQEEVIRSAKFKTKQVSSTEIFKKESLLQVVKDDESKKFTSQGIQMKSSFESKIPKPTKFFKILLKSNTVEQKVKEIQSEPTQSVGSNVEWEKVKTINNLKSGSKNSETFTSGSVISQASKGSQKKVGTSKKELSAASTSKTNARQSTVKINISEKKLTDIKKTAEKSRLFNKNIQKKSSVALPVKSKASIKPIKELKNTSQEIPMIKKTFTISNKNSKKKKIL